MRLQTSRRFERDLARAKRHGKNLEKLWAVVERLLEGQSLDPRHRPHRLSGNWASSWECHLEPDWLLVWNRREDALVLVRTGSHSDLFG